MSMGRSLAFTGWDGPDLEALKPRITADLDRMSANGMFVFNLASGRKSPGEAPYLSPGHMDEVKFIVQEAAKRNMRFWIQDESNYPSGFAGGYIQQRYPELTMQVMTADICGACCSRGDTADGGARGHAGDLGYGDEHDRDDQAGDSDPVPADGQLKCLTPAEGSTRMSRT